MKPRLAEKIYPTILATLDLLDRIKRTQRGDDVPSCAVESSNFRRMLEELESSYSDPEHDLCRRALTYWIDEMMVHTPWPGAKEWKNHLLEVDLYGTRRRAFLFFEDAGRARARSRDSLKTFYLCAALGFRGIYRREETPAPSTIHRPPPTGLTPPPFDGDSRMAQTEAEAPRPGPEITWPAPPPGGPSGAPIEPAAPPRVSSDSSPADPRSEGLFQTLEEWAASVYAVVAPPRVTQFITVQPVEYQRPASPLQGRRIFLRAANVLGWMGLITLVLAVVVAIVLSESGSSP